MLQGTGSDVGKSLIVTALARAFARRGVAVRPFKPQNMSNNAAVASDGGEIGRAQALQARACGVAPSVDMNPILLKPESERGSQVIVRGRATGTLSAREYHALKSSLLPTVLDSFARLSREADLILVEGAGSPAEVNLRAGDIANMGFAEAADIPVVLVGDIDRGGVIASLVGTIDLLTAAERTRTRGFIVNKFRGDPALFADGMRAITERTSVPAGVAMRARTPDTPRSSTPCARMVATSAHPKVATRPVKRPARAITRGSSALQTRRSRGSARSRISALASARASLDEKNPRCASPTLVHTRTSGSAIATSALISPA